MVDISKEEYARIVRHAWKDEEFRKRLQTSPKEALKELDIEFPEGTNVEIINLNPNTFYLPLPTTPVKTKEMKDEELEQLAASGFPWGWSLIEQSIETKGKC